MPAAPNALTHQATATASTTNREKVWNCDGDTCDISQAIETDDANSDPLAFWESYPQVVNSTSSACDAQWVLLDWSTYGPVNINLITLRYGPASFQFDGPTNTMASANATAGAPQFDLSKKMPPAVMVAYAANPNGTTTLVPGTDFKFTVSQSTVNGRTERVDTLVPVNLPTAGTQFYSVQSLKLQWRLQPHEIVGRNFCFMDLSVLAVVGEKLDIHAPSGPSLPGGGDAGNGGSSSGGGLSGGAIAAIILVPLLILGPIVAILLIRQRNIARRRAAAALRTQRLG